ncbi:cupredoxin domain-containing protein [Candidatus Nomurabacteria bacterium]|nr:cupredoxin domain-containing protein [Candidatus Nomurabacteria bacterium]
MKKFWSIVVIVLVIGGIFYVVNKSPTDSDDQMMEDDSVMMEDHGDSMMDENNDEIMGEGDNMMKDDSMMTEGQTFNVKGVNFAFDVTEIKVKKGDTVTINFEATEGFHDWVVDEFSAKTQQVRPGTKTSVTFTADKEGTFEYYCSVGSHRQMGMVGKLIVE